MLSLGGTLVGYACTIGYVISGKWFLVSRMGCEAYRSWFGSAVDSIHDQRSGSPESLAAWAFVGFLSTAKPGRNPLWPHKWPQTGKNFDFRLRRDIIAKTEYPGVAQLVGRDIWDVEVGCSSHLTRTKTPLKSLISEGFFLFFVYCGAKEVSDNIRGYFRHIATDFIL